MQISLKDFGLMMQAIATAFAIELPKERVNLYHYYLKDVPAEWLRRATDRIIKTRIYSTFPSIAEIKMTAEGTGETELEDRARIGWEDAGTALIEGREPNDPVVSLTIKLAFGSWRGFGDTDPNNDAADRKHFIACYKVAAKETLEPNLLTGQLRQELEATRKRIAELKPKSEMRQIENLGAK